MCLNELMYQRNVWVVQRHERYNTLIYVPIMSDVDYNRMIDEEAVTKEASDLINKGFIITKPHTPYCFCALLSKSNDLKIYLLVEYILLDNQPNV